MRKIQSRQEDRKIDPHIEEQFGGGRLLAAISSRPGQCGRADGYVNFILAFLYIERGKGVMLVCQPMTMTNVYSFFMYVVLCIPKLLLL